MEFSDIHVGSRLLRSPGVLVDHRVYERFCVDPGNEDIEKYCSKLLSIHTGFEVYTSLASFTSLEKAVKRLEKVVERMDEGSLPEKPVVWILHFDSLNDVSASSVAKLVTDVLASYDSSGIVPGFRCKSGPRGRSGDRNDAPRE